MSLGKRGNSAYQDVSSTYSYIGDPNERRRLALAEIDKAPLGWYHLRLVLVTGIGFFTDAYSLFAVNLVTTLLGMVYWHDSNNGVIPDNSVTAIKVASSAGTIAGQIFFGYLADVLGRKRMYGIELLIIISTTLGQALCAPSYAMNLVGVLVFWRLVMGIGVGGDYPLSAVITAEMADTRWRGAMVAFVFAMQGFGQFAAALVAFAALQLSRGTLQGVDNVSECTGKCLIDADVMWRIILGFGGIPGWFALYYRLTIPETPRYTFDVLHDPEKATADSDRFRSGKIGDGHADPVRRAKLKVQMRSKYTKSRPGLRELARYFRQWKNMAHLVGTAGSWFFLDIAFYGLNLNTGSFTSIIGFSDNDNVYDLLHSNVIGQFVLVCAGAIPGYWCTVLLVDTVGRKPLQIGGFIILTIIFAIIGFAFDHLSQGSLLALYILAQFFFNFGPNATTFIVPSECFPTRLRATAYGISAAAGKAGAVIAQLAFVPLANRGATPGDPHPWLDRVMRIFALFMLCGVLTSLLIPETKRRKLEELAEDSEPFAAASRRASSAASAAVLATGSSVRSASIATILMTAGNSPRSGSVVSPAMSEYDEVMMVTPTRPIRSHPRGAYELDDV